jgi:hypothetical protein
MRNFDPILLGLALGLAANLLFALLLVFVRRLRTFSVRHVIVRLLKWSVATDEGLHLFILSELGGEIAEVLPNRAAASTLLYSENESSATLRIMTNRGVGFSDPGSERDHPVSGWRQLPQTRVLLMNPHSKNADRRFRELKPLSAMPGWAFEHFQADINGAARKLGTMEHVDVRFHNEPSVFRIVLTDRYGYISGFPRNDFGRNKRVFKVRSGSLLFELFAKYFEEAWSRSDQVSL